LKKKIKNDLDLLDSKTIYEKEIKCKAHFVVREIEEEAFYMIGAIMKKECEIFKEKKIKSADFGDLHIKITIKIEEDND